jgi:alkylglycerol monooxygenase
MDYVPYAVPFFVLAMVLELAYGVYRGRNTYRLNDAIGSLFMGILRTVNKFVLIGVGGYVYYSIEQYYALWRMDSSSWMTWAFTWVAYDLCYYWFHRISHERQIFWASHVAHHQSEDYNLSTALRQTSTGFLLGWVFFLPLFLLGVPIEVYITVASINLIYQFWVHTEHVPKLGWLEWILITPSNHRVHHAQNDHYLDRNYGGFFIIWDRLFGTFQEELEEEPCIYGIRGALHTFNPFWANVHIYVNMLQDAWRTRSLKDKLYIWVSRTGWRPADVAERFPRLKTDLAEFHKYDPVVRRGAGAYAMFHLLTSNLALTLMLANPADVYWHNAVIVAMLTLNMICVAWWLDGRDTAMRLEGVRMVLLPLVIALAAITGYSSLVLASLLAFWVANGLFLWWLRQEPLAVEA